MQTKLLLGAVLLLGLAACGGSTPVTTGGGGNDGSGGSGGTGSTGGSSGTGAGTCDSNYSTDLAIAVTQPAGAPAATCTVPNAITFDGEVRTKDGDIFVDTCGTTAGCANGEVKISISGSKLTADDAKQIPDGTFVHVVWTLLPVAVGSDQCQSAVLVRNLPTWQGVTNPTASHASLWLFATQGAVLSKVGDAADRAALTAEEVPQCTTKDIEPVVFYNVELAATDANVSVVAEARSRQLLTIPSGAQKGSYAMINDVVVTPGNVGTVRSYAIVRQAP